MTDKEIKKQQQKKIAEYNNLNIRNAIKARGYKLIDVAKGIGVDKASLTQYLDGDMSLTKCQSIARFLGCSLDELLGGNEKKALVCPHCGKPLHIKVE